MTELEYALNKVGCKALITAAQFKTSDYIAMLEEIAPEIRTTAPGMLQAARLPDLRLVIQLGNGEPHPGMFDYGDNLHGLAGEGERQRLAELDRQLQFDDPINIQFTSGTTGAPKAATLTHHNIVNNAYFVGETMALSERDRLCIPVPMYHCFGMVLGTLDLRRRTAPPWCFLREGFDADSRCWRPSRPSAAPRCMACRPCSSPNSSMRTFERFDLIAACAPGSSPGALPIELMRAADRRMHLGEITIAYGMTETGPVSFETSVTTRSSGG